MTTTLLHNIGQKKGPLNRSLTLEYLKGWANKLLLGFLEGVLDKLVQSVIFEIDDTATTLITAYEEAENISPQEAEEVYPHIKELRKVITKHNKRFRDIDYADSKEMRQKFITLIRLTNRVEARVQRKRYQDSETEPAPVYIKEKMMKNSKEIVGNALQQEANY